jgi:O-acetyl-ADP-ribose deacetylase (regulator of RNase III)
MGSGVAKAFFIKWPQVRSKYIEEGHQELGGIQMVPVDTDLFVVNAWTQKYYGYDKKQYASMIAIILCFQKAIHEAKKLGITEIYTPMIGSGLGGLKWEIVYDALIVLINEHKDINITVCKL